MNFRGLHRMLRLLPVALVVGAILVGGPALADGKDGKPKKKEKPAAEKKQPAEKKPAAKEKPAKKKPAEKAAEKPAKKETETAETAEEKAEDAKPKPETVKAKRRPVVIRVELSGVFEAQKTAEVVLRPKQWSDLKVLSAVEHGASVQRGDPLVTFDFEKIDRQIADLRSQLKLKDLALKLAEQQLKTLEATTPMDLAAAERDNRETQADLDYYFETERPLALKSADMMLRMSKFYAEYAEEELRQLKKMYEADELTEETEEIILKRARFQAEMSRFSHELEKVDHDRMLKTLLPRREKQMKESAKRSALELKKIRASLPAALKQQRITHEQARVEHDRAEEKLDELLADRKEMRVTAPIDGVVYYGQASRGKFASADSVADDLTRGGSVSANEVFMTIVQPTPMFVRATVPEKELEYVEAGLEGDVVPTALPDAKLSGIVERVTDVPISSGTFEARVTLAKSDDGAKLMPAMTCKVKCLGYAKRNALTLPPKAVGSDPIDEDKRFVMVLGKDGEQKKRPVTVGKEVDEAVEILKGLKEGDEVLAAYPDGD